VRRRSTALWATVALVLLILAPGCACTYMMRQGACGHHCRQMHAACIQKACGEHGQACCKQGQACGKQGHTCASMKPAHPTAACATLGSAKPPACADASQGQPPACATIRQGQQAACGASHRCGEATWGRAGGHGRGSCCCCCCCCSPHREVRVIRQGCGHQSGYAPARCGTQQGQGCKKECAQERQRTGSHAGCSKAN